MRVLFLILLSLLFAASAQAHYFQGLGQAEAIGHHYYPNACKPHIPAGHPANPYPFAVYSWAYGPPWPGQEPVNYKCEIDYPPESHDYAYPLLCAATIHEYYNLSGIGPETTNTGTITDAFFGLGDVAQMTPECMNPPDLSIQHTEPSCWFYIWNGSSYDCTNPNAPPPPPSSPPPPPPPAATTTTPTTTTVTETTPPPAPRKQRWCKRHHRHPKRHRCKERR